MQDIQELENHCIWSGIVHSDLKWQNNMETFTLEAKGASQITLVYSRQFVPWLTLCIVC